MPELPDYSLTIEANGGVLLACITAAEVSTQMVVDYTNKIGAKLRETGLGKMLFVRRCPILDPREALMTAYMLRNSLRGSLKIAIVDEYGNDRSAIAASERAARRAGFDVHSFSTADKAREWLNSPNNVALATDSLPSPR